MIASLLNCREKRQGIEIGEKFILMQGWKRFIQSVELPPLNCGLKRQGVSFAGISRYTERAGRTVLFAKQGGTAKVI